MPTQNTESELYQGKGTMYARKRNSDDPLLPLGNCTAIALAIATTETTMRDYQHAGGGNLDSFIRIDSVTMTVTCGNFNPTNLARATGGTLSSDASATQTAEEHAAGPAGSFIKFNKVPDSSGTITVTDTDASTTYVEGVDYEVQKGGITLVAGGSIPEDGTLEVSYTSVDTRVVEMLTTIGDEYELYFDGLNEVRSGKPFLLTYYRCKLNPTGSIPLINDDYATYDIPVSVLQDRTITGSGKSKYLKAEIAA